MKYIKITSQGEIDERAFSLIGASSKRGDETKIGMFGSGLKYSLAFLLKNQIKFRVFSSYREIQFTTVLENFRNKEFWRIYVNGEKTSFVTDMGMDWQDWFVVREIFCNALDEGDGNISITNLKTLDNAKPIEDSTVFYIEVNEKMEELINNWSLYFAEKRKDCAYKDEDGNRLYLGGDNLIVYRKGIRCMYQEKVRSIFHYDMNWIKINESREISSEWDFKYTLVNFIKGIEDEKIIHRFLYNINSYWEKSLYWASSAVFSNEWLIQVYDKILVPYESAGFWEKEIKELKSRCLILPSEMIRSLKISFANKITVIGENENGDEETKIINELDKRQKFLLNDAISFLEKSSYKINYPIKIVSFYKENILGQAKDKTILLSEKLFNLGVRKIVSTIIEENEHCNTGFNDETRQFQEHFIELLISAYEDKSGKYI